MSSLGNEVKARARELMMAALDGEIEPQERRDLERLIAQAPDLRREWERLNRVKEATSEMRYSRPPEETWEAYFESVYNRLERGIGWTLVSLGAIVLAGYGLWEFVRQFLADTGIPVLVRFAVFALLLGTVILIVSVLRERLFARRTDPYKEIQR